MTDSGGAKPLAESSVEPVVSGPKLWHLLVYYLVCLLGAGYAELLAIIPGTGISIWLPSGLLLGALLANPRRTWVLWIAVASLAELTGNALWFGNSLPVALLVIFGNAVEALVGAYLIGRFIGWPFRFETLRSVLGFVVLGAVVAPIAAAAIGAVTLAWSEGQDLQQSFWLFWIGDATGMLIAGPAVVAMADLWRRRSWPAVARWPEAAALAIGAILVAAASLSGRLPFGLIIIPLMLLAAVRFHFWGSIASSVTLTLLAAAFQLSSINPFVLVGNELASHVQLQLFLAISTFSTLVVAALAQQNEETLQRLVEANHGLEDRVRERTSRLAASEARLRKVLETAQVGIAFGNEKGMLTDANRTLGLLLGRPLTELGGGMIAWVTVTAAGKRTQLSQELVRLASEGRAGPLEVVLVRPDGTEVPAIFAASGLGGGEHVAFVVDQTEQKRHEEQIGLLMRELNHRAKNTLGLVQSIARHTKAASAAEFLDRFDERIHALAALQNLLVDNKWKGAPLDRIVRDQLSHLRDALETRISVAGPAVILTAPAAQAIALAIHELATNASKYGALSNDSGRIAIEWKIRNGRLALSWTESGGPRVREPSREGFGTTVIGAMVKSALGSEVSIAYEPEGLNWGLEGPLESFAVAEDGA